MASNFVYRWEWLATDTSKKNETIKSAKPNSSKSNKNISRNTDEIWKPYNDQIQVLLNDSVKKKEKTVIF